MEPAQFEMYEPLSHAPRGVSRRVLTPTMVAMQEAAARKSAERVARIAAGLPEPVEPAPVPEPLPTPDDESDDAPPPAGAPRTLLQDAEWVYQNMTRKGVKQADAPSCGAWWLLEQARADPKVLLQPLMLIAKRDQIDEEELAIKRDCRRTAAELKKTIDRLRAVPI